MLYDLNPEVYYYCIHTAYSCHILLHCSDCTSTCVCVWPCVCVCAGYYVFMWSANRQCVMENETRGQGHGCTCMCDLRKRCMSEPNRNMERDFFFGQFLCEMPCLPEYASALFWPNCFIKSHGKSYISSINLVAFILTTILSSACQIGSHQFISWFTIKMTFNFLSFCVSSASVNAKFHRFYKATLLINATHVFNTNEKACLKDLQDFTDPCLPLYYNHTLAYTWLFLQLSGNLVNVFLWQTCL